MFQHAPGEALADDDDNGKKDTCVCLRRDCSIADDFSVRIMDCEELDDLEPDDTIETDGESLKNINWQ